MQITFQVSKTQQMMSFQELNQKYNPKKRGNNLHKSLPNASFFIFKWCEIYLGDELFTTDVQMVSLQPTRKTHWVAYIDPRNIASYEVPPLEKLSMFIIKRNEYCLYSEYKPQAQGPRRYSCFAAFRVCIIYLTIVAGISFKSAVSFLYYHMMR